VRATSLAAYAQGQERLSSAILGACDPGDAFPTKVRASLATAFSLLAADPGLARLLTISPEPGDDELYRLQWDWFTRYGSLLRAAAADGAPELPFFLEPKLIAGIGFSVAQHLRKGEGPRLLECLLPTAHWYLLSYYLPAVEILRLGAE
jgi:hypothetical protein